MRLFIDCCRTLGTLAILGVLSACGAGDGTGLDPNGNPDQGTAPPPPGPSLAAIQANVFTPSCAVAGCHGGANAQRGLRLDPGYSAASLINVSSPVDGSLVRVIPYQPNTSFLIQKLEGTQSLGDRMPQGGPYIPQELINDIRQWISEGANP
jgi:hypothetical protein